MEQQVVELMSRLINLQAVNPRSKSGSEGESKRAKFLQGELLKMMPEISISKYDIEDPEMNLIRPNFTATLKGKDPTRSLFIICHLDTVPEGDLSLWDTDPFSAQLLNGRVYGRGAEDNLQGMVSTIFAMKQIYDEGVKPEINVSLVCVSDEETGSTFGIQHLVKQGLFKPQDLIIVPDYGTPEGNFIEVAEKGILWFKVEVLGKQAHASRPQEGINAHLKGMEFNLKLYQALKESFSLANHLFEPATSTFEPTRKDNNVDNINTIPGKDIAYFDCRVLPEYNLKEVLSFINSFAKNFTQENGVEINISTVQKEEASPPTDPESPVARKLLSSIAKSLNPEGLKVGGIGGGTCAALLRKAGIPAAVWAITNHAAHQANENSQVSNLLKEIEVFYTLMRDL